MPLKEGVSQGQLIHPIVMYPYTQRDGYDHLTALYEQLVRPLSENPQAYSRPLTVMNRQTFYTNAMWRFDKDRNARFVKFRQEYVEKYSEIVDAWSVDSCQMWLAGLGVAFDKNTSGEDVYWLIPGDFDYASPSGQDVLNLLSQIPDAVLNHEQDLCLGEIEVDINSSKQLIDTYGTYGLLYNWFPFEAQRIRKITDKPRTEFFAIRHSFLREVLRQRWYAYEQTIVILLYGVLGNKRIHTIRIGSITDLPQGRETLAAAMQQVERTERVLKLFWREMHEKSANWPDTFRKLDTQSEHIRGAALVILENLLR
ncbi:MAG TPA: hypothetical protein VM118_02240 [Acidobacteriota bacterium]|nr:hypothetical protein [Acidobacteriota bacterium]